MKPERPSNTDRRRGAERDAAQQTAGQPRKAADKDHLQKPEYLPSKTARESDRDPADDRHANASFEGPKGEPRISDDNPPRGDRGKR